MSSCYRALNLRWGGTTRSSPTIRMPPLAHPRLRLQRFLVSMRTLSQTFFQTVSGASHKNSKRDDRSPECSWILLYTETIRSPYGYICCDNLLFLQKSIVYPAHCVARVRRRSRPSLRFFSHQGVGIWFWGPQSFEFLGNLSIAATESQVLAGRHDRTRPTNATVRPPSRYPLVLPPRCRRQGPHHQQGFFFDPEPRPGPPLHRLRRQGQARRHQLLDHPGPRHGLPEL